MVERAILRGQQIGLEFDLLAAFRRCQPLDDRLHQPVDVLLAGTGSENWSKLLIKLLRQPVDVGIGNHLREAARLLQAADQFRDELPQQFGTELGVELL